MVYPTRNDVIVGKRKKRSEIKRERGRGREKRMREVNGVVGEVLGFCTGSFERA